MTFLWYLPNTIEPGHRGDDAVDGYGTLDHSVDLARTAEEHGWEGALIGTGWGRPDTFTVATAIAARIERLRGLSASLDRDLPPLEFGLRITTLVRDTTAEAWRDAEARVAEMAAQARLPRAQLPRGQLRGPAVGQQRLLDLADRGDVLDSCLYTAPGDALIGRLRETAPA
jgi:alkanesulfonate monooxygenase SsuD/methylene tetrahydromethanopterin reductase-like flavin-dependent oxidoreductase (luciferase family)